MEFLKQVERFGVQEISQKIETKVNNPFTDIKISAQITKPCGEIVTVKGFYDKDSCYKVRFMPDSLGVHNIRLLCSDEVYNDERGEFVCTLNSIENKGPIHATGEHFYYADGSHAFICGTTLYAWWYRPKEICDTTLSELKKYGFNKVRMLVFPKYLAGFVDFDLIHQPPCLPFESNDGKFDFKRPNVDYFELLEQRISQLNDIGVEADVILFHNYDFGKWGIDDQLSDDDAMFYLDYIIARISAYKNVWWSLANEYDIFKNPDGSGCISKIDRRDWDRIGRYIYKEDPYKKLISVHNIGPLYPDAEWLSHVSAQFPNTYGLLTEAKHNYKKPVINDEYQYEGNLIDDWGNLTGEEETVRHWLSVMAGAYATHGECYVVDGNRNDIFWTYGGKMYGESAARISYLKSIVETLPFDEMSPDYTLCDGRGSYCISKEREVYFYLFTDGCQQRNRKFGVNIPDGKNRTYEVEVYDLWEMKTIRKFRYFQGKLENPTHDVPEGQLERVINEPGLIGVRAVLI